MKKLFLFSTLNFISIITFSQTNSFVCGTIDTNTIGNVESTIACQNSINYSPDEFTQTKNVRVTLHVIQKTDGTGNFQDTPLERNWLENTLFNGQVNYIMENLSPMNLSTTSAYIQNSKIKYIVDDIFFHQDTYLWDFSMGVGSSLAVSKANSIYNQFIINNPNVVNKTNSIHIFFVDGGGQPNQGRACNIGCSNWSLATNVYQNYLVNTPWNVAGLIRHELGHNLGLFHSWGGDGCDDTPTNNNCWNGPTCSNNVMDYNAGANALTECQLGKVHYNLLNSIRNVLIEDCYDTNSLIIDNYKLNEWNNERILPSNLIIKQGSTLKVNCLISMPKNGKIIIEQGGRLIVDGATITNNCGELWSGIEVRGDMNASQYTQGAQGILDILNGAVIENARFAVHTSEHDANGNYIWGTFGGIVRIRDSYFKNNVSGVDFGPYQNFLPTNPSVKRNDLSFIQSTEFTWDDNGNMVNLGRKPYSHIGMWNSHGIQLRGNKFSNDANITTYSVLERGRGIVSFDAEFRVDGKCTSLTYPCSSYDNSTFNNLTYGIQAENSNAFNSFVVRQSDFTNCLRGAYLKNVDYAEIVNSSFDIAEAFFGNSSYGIYLDNCSGYEIEENNFFTTAGNATYGIYTKASGTTANEIYNNQLNNLQIANQTEGVNGLVTPTTSDGLVFRCNQNSNTSTADIAVTTGVVNKNQGNCGTSLSPANNLFAGTATNDIWLNPSMPFMDYYHSSGNTQLVPANNFPPSAVTIQNCGGNPFNQSTNCPSRQQVVLLPATLLGNISSLKTQQQGLYDAIDNGNTKALINLINSTAPDWQIKNELMAASPYLSEQVLVAMLSKSPALPDWVVQQVLYANAPLTDKVFITMLQRTPALPNHIIHHLALESSPLSKEEQIAVIKRVPALPDWVITPVMIENSPLFDEVLITLMERTPKIADWSIRNIFVRNTPLSTEVTEVLDNQGYPNWLITNINNSPFVAGNAIEKPQPLSPLLEQYSEIGAVNHKIQLTENELFRTYLHDTTGTYGLNDVLVYLKQQKHSNEDKATCCAKKLSCALIKNKEHQEAQNTIDSLRQDSALTDFCDYYTALNELGQATPGTIDSITNAAITQTIESVANSTNAGKEKAGAEALLQFAGLDNFSETFEPLNTNLRTKSTDGKPAPGTIELIGKNLYDDYFKIYPNPNTGNFYVEYKIQENNQAYFIFTDISGKELWRKPFNDKKGVLTIKEDIQPGIYLYQIVINNTVFDSNKIVITQ